MGLFSKPEVVILKESNDARVYLSKLEELLPKVQGELKKKIEKEIAITKAGIFGEDQILFELKNSNMDMVVLHDIYIETKDGKSAQIDFIVITSKLAFILECKNLIGNIEINSQGNFIRTMEYGKKQHREGIYSPITQNIRHMEVLKECKAEEKGALKSLIFRNTFHDFYKSLIVLANPKTILNDRYAKKEVKNQVIRADQLIHTIKAMNNESKEMASSLKAMREWGESILSHSIEGRKDYFKKYEDILQEADQQNSLEMAKNKTELQEEKKRICPKCGAELVLRTAKRGQNVGQTFYGCSAFPKCRYILNEK